MVRLHAEGWSAKAISGYLKINRDTVYQVLRRWFERGEEGLEAMRLEGYAPKTPRGPRELQQTLFPFAEAL